MPRLDDGVSVEEREKLINRAVVQALPNYLKHRDCQESLEQERLEQERLKRHPHTGDTPIKTMELPKQYGAIDSANFSRQEIEHIASAKLQEELNNALHILAPGMYGRSYHG